MDAPLYTTPPEPHPQTQQFYVDALKALDDAQMQYVVGGGYAMAYYTGIRRDTKDLDIFVRPQDRDRCLTTLTAAGYQTEFFFPFWIAKALHGEAFIDIIYNSGNGLCAVDDDWMAYSVPIDVHGYTVRLVPAEEQLWSKAFVMDRDRFDGADVIHLILTRGRQLDWQRILRRFKNHERVLLAHVVLFGYAYPSEKKIIPEFVMQHLETIVNNEKPFHTKVCFGFNLAQHSYSAATTQWGFRDGRLQPYGPLTQDELEQLPKQ